MAVSHSELIKEFEDFAIENFPDEPWLQLRNLEDCDAWRVRRYSGYRFKHVYQTCVMVQDDSGLWHRLESSDIVHSIIRSLIVQGRDRAGEELSEHSSNDAVIRHDYSYFLTDFCELKSMHVINVTRQLSQVIHTGKERALTFDSVSPEDFDDRDSNPIIPVSFHHGVPIGGCIDLRTAKYIDPLATGEMLMLNHGWGFPMCDKEIMDSDSPGKIAMETAIKERWGDDLLTRLCRHLLGTSKNVDVVTAPTNWGKSTLITAMEKALPGMVGRLEAYKAFSRQGDKFTQTAIMLSEKLIVFIDEAGQDDPDRSAELSPGVLNTLTDDLLQVEKKFKDNEAVPRLGTAVLIGHTWAAINASAQGIDTRVQWAFRANETDPMTTDDRLLILSSDGIEYLRVWILRRCRELWETSEDGRILDDLTISANNRQALAEFKMARSDPLAASLIEEFEVGELHEFVRSSKIKDVLEDANGGEKISNNQIGAKIKIAFHNTGIRSGRKKDTLTKKQERVWFGIRERGTV